MLPEKKRDEEKRTKVIRGILIATSVIIMLALVFFIMASSVRNPLEGEWHSKEHGYFLDVEDDNEVTLEGTFDGVQVEIELQYKLDKKAKTVSIVPTAESYAEAAKNTNGEITPAELDELLDSFITSYDYSLGRNKLTLTEREFGEKYVFTRVDD